MQKLGWWMTDYHFTEEHSPTRLCCMVASALIRLLFLPPVSPRHSPTTTSHRWRLAPASRCPPFRCRPPCPVCPRATAAQRHREDSTNCVAPTAAAKPECFTTTTPPAAASFPCWLTRWASNNHWSIISYLYYWRGHSTKKHTKLKFDFI